MKNLIIPAMIVVSALSFGTANAQHHNNQPSTTSVSVTKVVAIGGSSKAISGDAVSVLKDISISSSNTNVNVPVVLNNALNDNTLRIQ